MIRISAALLGPFAALAGLLGLTVQSQAQAQPAQRSQAAPPAEWIVYAELTTRAVTDRLQGEDERAMRLRVYLHELQVNSSKTRTTLMLKVWVDKAGLVTKIDFPPFAHEQTNVDLRNLLEGFHLPDAPPAGIRLPMRMAVDIETKAENP